MLQRHSAFKFGAILLVGLALGSTAVSSSHGAIISGTRTTNSSFEVDLTAEGTADWIKTATGPTDESLNGAQFVSKIGATRLGNYTSSFSVAQQGLTSISYVWSDGDNTFDGGAGPGTQTAGGGAGSDFNAMGRTSNGQLLSFTASSSGGTDTLRVYIAESAGSGGSTVGTFTASLASGGLPYSDVISIGPGTQAFVQTIIFSGTGPSDLLTVTWGRTSGSNTNSRVYAEGITLSSVVAPIPEPASLGVLGLVGVTMFARRRRSVR